MYQTPVCIRPDTTVTVDWALKTNCPFIPPASKSAPTTNVFVHTGLSTCKPLFLFVQNLTLFSIKFYTNWKSGLHVASQGFVLVRLFFYALIIAGPLNTNSYQFRWGWRSAMNLLMSFFFKEKKREKLHDSCMVRTIHWQASNHSAHTELSLLNRE